MIRMKSTPNNLLIIFLFLIPYVNSAQKIKDSIKVKKVAYKTEAPKDKDLSLELAAEDIILITRTKLNLLSAPTESGVIIGKLEKGIRVQQLDISGTYYLICYEGKCGFVPKSSLIIKDSGKKAKDQKVKDSLQLPKTFKS